MDPAIVSFIGAVVGGFIASLTVTKRKMRSIAHDVVVEHERECRVRVLTPSGRLVREEF